MTNKQESNIMKKYKQQVLTAYLSLQMPGLTCEKKREWESKYEEAKKQLAECIATELT